MFSNKFSLITLIVGMVELACNQARATEARTYDDYLDQLGLRESSNDYSIINPFGYAGRYQFGEQALGTCKLYLDDGTRTNDWRGPFSEEASEWDVNQISEFLANHQFQEFAIRRFNEMQWAAIVSLGLTRFVGKTVGGIQITQSGMIGGAHLLGPGNLRKFLNSDGARVPRDGNGTPITEYITLFANYETPFH